MIADIYDEFSDSNSERPQEYFIGSIVVCEGAETVWDLIDGQPRMTTLYLVLCAVRDRLEALRIPPMQNLLLQIAATHMDDDGNEQHRFRLDLQYEDSRGVLETFAKQEASVRTDWPNTRSTENIRSAYIVVSKELSSRFGEDRAALSKFYAYLVNRVKLIRIESPSIAKALKVFETINDRGVGLNSMDLLKNLLFMKAKREEFEKLKDAWKKLSNVIFQMGEKPLRFLRYFVFSQFNVERLREDEIYKWLVDNENVCGYASE